MKTRIAINGFGRIGRNLFRLLVNHPTIEVVAINDIADVATMAHLIKYDSIHGILPEKVSHDTTGLIIADKHYLFFNEKNIANLDWKKHNIDYVIESTGKYKTFDEINAHILAGAKKVILSAPGGTPVSAQLQFARTVARRAERRLWTLHKQDPLPEIILRFINRLSDLFFVMARYEMQQQNWTEEKWQSFAYKRKKKE